MVASCFQNEVEQRNEVRLVVGDDSSAFADCMPPHSCVRL